MLFFSFFFISNVLFLPDMEGKKASLNPNGESASIMEDFVHKYGRADGQESKAFISTIMNISLL